MQLTNTLCALILAVTVSSVALPNAEPIAAAVANAQWDNDWGCGERGQPCGKVKRAAEAFAEALAEPNAQPELDSPYARYARQLTRDLAAIVAETQDDPVKYFASLALRDDYDLDKRDALAEAGWGCGERGQPCGKLRRAAEAIAEAVAVPESEAWDWGCGERGQPCGKAKRDALALAHAADIVLRTI